MLLDWRRYPNIHCRIIECTTANICVSAKQTRSSLLWKWINKLRFFFSSFGLSKVAGMDTRWPQVLLSAGTAFAAVQWQPRASEYLTSVYSSYWEPSNASTAPFNKDEAFVAAGIVGHWRPHRWAADSDIRNTTRAWSAACVKTSKSCWLMSKTTVKLVICSVLWTLKPTCDKKKLLLPLPN